MKFSLLSDNTRVAFEWWFYSSCGRYILHLRSTLRTADCDVIVNLHGLTWRNILPIESDIASSKLNVLITTLVVWQNGRSHWPRHIEFGYITVLLIKGRKPLILESRTICLLSSSTENFELLNTNISYDTNTKWTIDIDIESEVFCSTKFSDSTRFYGQLIDPTSSSVIES